MVPADTPKHFLQELGVQDMRENSSRGKAAGSQAHSKRTEARGMGCR